MATITYINNDYETLAEAMQQLVEMGYFASVEYDSENTAVVCKDSDENAVLTIAEHSANHSWDVILRFDDSTTKSSTIGNSVAGTAKLLYCYVGSGGCYISLSGTNALYAGLIISKTNNGKIGVAVLCPALGSTAAARLIPFCWATDDDPEQTDTKFTFSAPTPRNQHVLNDVPTCSPPNVVSIFPDIKHTFTSMITYTDNVSTPPLNFEQDGKRYLWVGYFAIRDEEA